MCKPLARQTKRKGERGRKRQRKRRGQTACVCAEDGLQATLRRLREQIVDNKLEKVNGIDKFLEKLYNETLKTSKALYLLM